ncbi:uncharacterized protein LOC106706530 [Latimeria chalumnae]|uniref:uncharacterized protein LOC106706530 n=1 Tax=Latimeria chalumnae TaxID=7897 RepID=UPI00313CAC69
MIFYCIVSASLFQGVSSLLAPWQVSSSVCKKFPNPTNGFTYCRTDYCVVRCNEGFQFEEEPANGYFCHPLGIWTTVPLGKNVPWPNCTTKDNGKRSSKVYTGHALGPGSNSLKIKRQRRPKQPDTIPPSITNCPQDITITTERDHVQVTWEEPEVSDNSGVFISIASISSGSFFRYGTHQITYTAGDEAGNEASCQFQVVIKKPDPACSVKPPSDGALACGTLLSADIGIEVRNWQFCVPLCMKGTDFHKRTGTVSFCKSSQSGTSWFHFDLVWQMTKTHMPESCIVRRHSGIKRGNDLQYYEGDCNVAAVQGQILQAVKQLLAKDPYFVSKCTLMPNTCGKYKIAKLNVRCGPGNNQKDTESPRVISCPQNIEVETKKGNPYWNDLPEVSWKEPIFEDNARGPLTITKGGSEVNNGDKLAYGLYSVVYTAMDPSGNTAKCSFEISVKSIACTMELPEHGAVVCGYPSVEGMDLMNVDCIVLCKSKFQLNSAPYPIYACSEEGLWWTFTSTFVPIGPHLTTLNYTCKEPIFLEKPKAADENFYFDGDCYDKEVQEVLMGHLEYFQRRTSAYQYCELNRDSCRKWKGYRNVTVFCGSE